MTQDDPVAAVLLFTHGRTYGPLRGLRAHRIAGEPDLDAAIGPFRAWSWWAPTPTWRRC